MGALDFIYDERDRYRLQQQVSDQEDSQTCQSRDGTRVALVLDHVGGDDDGLLLALHVDAVTMAMDDFI